MAQTEIELIETEALALAQQVDALQIHDQESYDSVLAIIEDATRFLRRMDSIFDPIIQKANQTHKEALAQKKRATTHAINAKLIGKQRVVRFNQDQERAQLDEQRRREAEAKREHEEMLLRAAEHAETQGAPRETVDAILDQPDTAPPPAAPPMHRIDKRVYTRDVWKGEVTDMKKLIAAAASGKAPPTVLMANQTAINALAKSLRDTMDIPGLRAYCDKVPAGRF